FTTSDQHQSYPKITHGGITAAILDEVIGRAIMITDPETFGVTIELTVRYKKPVPTKTELKAIGRITQDRGRIFSGSGELYLPNGEVAVEAEGRFMKRRLDQITDQDFSTNEWFAPEGELPGEIHL
ncbi:MAG: thioesterase, partial [Desulfuromonas sp.]